MRHGENVTEVNDGAWRHGSERGGKNVCVSFSFSSKSIHGMRKMLLVSFMKLNQILLMISI